jgi:hypothetical protein
MISSVSNQAQNQQVDLYIIKDSLTISDASVFSKNHDSIFIFSQPEQLSLSDSLYQVLINPLTVKSKPSGEYGFVPNQKTQFVPDWSIAIILILFILLASIRSASETYIPQIFQSIFNKKVATRLFREKVSTLFHITFRLDIFFLLVFGLFIYQIVNHYSEFSFNESIIYCGLIVVVFAFFMATKFTLYRISGTIFDTVSETREYIFHAKTGNRVMGLILFPVVLFLFLVKGNYAEYLLYFGIALVIILNIISILRGMVIIAQKVFSVYYLILYLCTLEILPLLIVWKILLIM